MNKSNKKSYLIVFTLILILALNFVSCNSKTENKDNATAEKSKQIGTFKIDSDSLERVVNSIIEISANDFYKNQDPLPIEFRNVQIKYYLKPSKEMLYVLCGQFQTQDKTQWTQFATIKNSDYEQWIGPNGLTYCENSTEIPYTSKDLSTELKTKLNSLIGSKK